MSTGGIVVFDPAEFITLFPLFATVDPAILQFNFDQATDILSNCCRSPVKNLDKRKRLLYLLTAHITKLSGALEPGGTPNPPGRIAQAAEGTVSATFGALGPEVGSGPWFQQTTWGAQVWQATLNLRTMHYIAAPTVIR